ncbi:hypothetical protein ABPG72_017494 [Tetrahymena utriculariae]
MLANQNQHDQDNVSDEFAQLFIVMLNMVHIPQVKEKALFSDYLDDLENRLKTINGCINQKASRLRAKEIFKQHLAETVQVVNDSITNQIQNNSQMSQYEEQILSLKTVQQITISNQLDLGKYNIKHTFLQNLFKEENVLLQRLLHKFLLKGGFYCQGYAKQQIYPQGTVKVELNNIRNQEIRIGVQIYDTGRSKQQLNINLGKLNDFDDIFQRQFLNLLFKKSKNPRFRQIIPKQIDLKQKHKNNYNMWLLKKESISNKLSSQCYYNNTKRESQQQCLRIKISQTKRQALLNLISISQIDQFKNQLKNLGQKQFNLYNYSLKIYNKSIQSKEQTIKYYPKNINKFLTKALDDRILGGGGSCFSKSKVFSAEPVEVRVLNIQNFSVIACENRQYASGLPEKDKKIEEQQKATAREIEESKGVNKKKQKNNEEQQKTANNKEEPKGKPVVQPTDKEKQKEEKQKQQQAQLVISKKEQLKEMFLLKQQQKQYSENEKEEQEEVFSKFNKSYNEYFTNKYVNEKVIETDLRLITEETLYRYREQIVQMEIRHKVIDLINLLINYLLIIKQNDVKQSLQSDIDLINSNLQKILQYCKENKEKFPCLDLFQYITILISINSQRKSLDKSNQSVAFQILQKMIQVAKFGAGFVSIAGAIKNLTEINFQDINNFINEVKQIVSKLVSDQSVADAVQIGNKGLFDYNSNNLAKNMQALFLKRIQYSEENKVQNDSISEIIFYFEEVTNLKNSETILFVYMQINYLMSKEKLKDNLIELSCRLEEEKQLDLVTNLTNFLQVKEYSDTIIDKLTNIANLIAQNHQFRFVKAQMLLYFAEIIRITSNNNELPVDIMNSVVSNYLQEKQKSVKIVYEGNQIMADYIHNQIDKKQILSEIRQFKKQMTKHMDDKKQYNQFANEIQNENDLDKYLAKYFVEMWEKGVKQRQKKLQIAHKDDALLEAVNLYVKQQITYQQGFAIDTQERDAVKQIINQFLIPNYVKPIDASDTAENIDNVDNVDIVDNIDHIDNIKEEQVGQQQTENMNSLYTNKVRLMKAKLAEYGFSKYEDQSLAVQNTYQIFSPKTIQQQQFISIDQTKNSYLLRDNLDQYQKLIKMIAILLKLQIKNKKYTNPISTFGLGMEIFYFLNQKPTNSKKDYLEKNIMIYKQLQTLVLQILKEQDMENLIRLTRLAYQEIVKLDTLLEILIKNEFERGCKQQCKTVLQGQKKMNYFYRTQSKEYVLKDLEVVNKEQDFSQAKIIFERESLAKKSYQKFCLSSTKYIQKDINSIQISSYIQHGKITFIPFIKSQQLSKNAYQQNQKDKLEQFQEENHSFENKSNRSYYSYFQIEIAGQLIILHLSQSQQQHLLNLIAKKNISQLKSKINSLAWKQKNVYNSKINTQNKGFIFGDNKSQKFLNMHEISISSMSNKKINSNVQNNSHKKLKVQRNYLVNFDNSIQQTISNQQQHYLYSKQNLYQIQLSDKKNILKANKQQKFQYLISNLDEKILGGGICGSNARVISIDKIPKKDQQVQQIMNEKQYLMEKFQVYTEKDELDDDEQSFKKFNKSYDEYFTTAKVSEKVIETDVRLIIEETLYRYREQIVQQDIRHKVIDIINLLINYLLIIKQNNLKQSIQSDIDQINQYLQKLSLYCKENRERYPCLDLYQYTEILITLNSQRQGLDSFNQSFPYKIMKKMVQVAKFGAGFVSIAGAIKNLTEINFDDIKNFINEIQQIADQIMSDSSTGAVNSTIDTYTDYNTSNLANNLQALWVKKLKVMGQNLLQNDPIQDILFYLEESMNITNKDTLLFVYMQLNYLLSKQQLSDNLQELTKKLKQTKKIELILKLANILQVKEFSDSIVDKLKNIASLIAQSHQFRYIKAQLLLYFAQILKTSNQSKGQFDEIMISVVSNYLQEKQKSVKIIYEGNQIMADFIHNHLDKKQILNQINEFKKQMTKHLNDEQLYSNFANEIQNESDIDKQLAIYFVEMWELSVKQRQKNLQITHKDDALLEAIYLYVKQQITYEDGFKIDTQEKDAKRELEIQGWKKKLHLPQ